MPTELLAVDGTGADVVDVGDSDEEPEAEATVVDSVTLEAASARQRVVPVKRDECIAKVGLCLVV